MTALPLTEAAAELGISPPTLRRWLSRGAPQARPGRRGRGGRALVDPRAVAAWRFSCEATQHAELEVLACELPALLAAAADRAFRDAPGRPADRAWLACFAWFQSVTALRDHLEARGVTLPELELPPQIDHLRSICSDFGTTVRS